jgi:hypothetical protein
MKILHLASLPLALSAAFTAAQTAPASPVTRSADTATAHYFDPEHPCASPWVVCDTLSRTPAIPPAPTDTPSLTRTPAR